MRHLIKTTVLIYLKHFRYYLITISIILVPLVLLRISAQFAYFGSLRVVFSTVLGVLFMIVSLFIEIILIRSSYHHISKPWSTINWSDQLKQAQSIFIRYVGLVIIIIAITGSVPLIIQPFKNMAQTKPLLWAALNTITTVWILGITILFLLSFYTLLIEDCSLKRAIVRGVHLIQRKPFVLLSKLIGGALLFGIPLILLSALTTIIIALVTHQTDLVLDSQLAAQFSPWWQQLVIDVYALLGLPLLIILTSALFFESQQTEKNATPSK